MKADDGDWLGSDPDQNPELVKANIDKLIEHEEAARSNRTPSERLADTVAQVTGSMGFVLFNLLFFSMWILANLGFLGARPFDPFPFGMLTMIVSLEAIVLSIFVLVSQNRMQAISDRRTELGVQVSLLTEHEVTRILRLVNRMADKMGIEESGTDELEKLEQDVDARQMIEQIEAKRNDAG